MRVVSLFLAIVAQALLVGPAMAHETRPAYLEIKETAPDEFAIVWKVPAMGDLRLGLYATLPEACRTKGEPSRHIEGSVYLERWSAICDGGLAGKKIKVDGLRSTMTDALVRIEYDGGATEVARLKPDAPAFVAAGRQSAFDVATTYVRMGVDHILTGVDHLLFVLCLILLVQNIRKLLMTVTAFTVAHSMTLAAATLGFVHVAAAPVEATIALSIIFLASELLRAPTDRSDITQRYPWLVAFTFGLLHGLGFAGALAEIGLPQGEIPLALFAFNVGVEAGQLAFIAAVLSVGLLGRILVPRIPGWTRSATAYAIGGTASYWVLIRLAAG